MVTGRPDAGQDAGATRSGDSLACNPLAQSLLGGSCSATQIDAIGQCLETTCKTQLEGCYGPNYTKGTFNGACAEQGQCTTKCSCDDRACYEACPISEACTTCARTFVDCGSLCVSRLGCALDAGAALAGLERACDDLRACCDSLKDAAAKSACMEAHAQVRPSGGFVCALVTPLFCP